MCTCSRSRAASVLLRRAAASKAPSLLPPRSAHLCAFAAAPCFPGCPEPVLRKAPTTPCSSPLPRRWRLLHRLPCGECSRGGDCRGAEHASSRGPFCRARRGGLAAAAPTRRSPPLPCVSPHAPCCFPSLFLCPAAPRAAWRRSSKVRALGPKQAFPFPLSNPLPLPPKHTRAVSMRLKSVKNIQKITASMKMVSAAKFARAERELRQARPIGAASSGMLSLLPLHDPLESPAPFVPFFCRRIFVCIPDPSFQPLPSVPASTCEQGGD